VASAKPLVGRWSVNVTFFRARRYQELTNRLPREKQADCHRAHFHHGLLTARGELRASTEAGGYPDKSLKKIELFVFLPVRIGSGYAASKIEAPL
jgi:hypothetical protein